jgi:hypothetical protein
MKKRIERENCEIGGTKNRRVQVRAARGSKKAAPRRNSFTKEKRQAFLAHFAATCNAKAAARAAGVSASTIWAWRKKDPQFCAAWQEALAQGYAGLEAELVRSSTQSMAVLPNEKAAARIGTVDPATALKVLESYRRNGDRRPGEVLIHPYEMEAVRARLEKKMKQLLIIDEEGRVIGEGERDGPVLRAEPLHLPAAPDISSPQGEPGEEFG